MLPHAFPFRLADRREHGGVVASLSLDGAQLAGSLRPPPFFAVEILAQAAHLLLAPAGGLYYLAGIREARLLAPLASGDRLVARAEVSGRFGAILRVTGRLERDGEPVATADLWLAPAGGEDVFGPGAASGRSTPGE